MVDNKTPTRIPILEYSTRVESWQTFVNLVADPDQPSLPPGERTLNIV